MAAKGTTNPMLSTDAAGAGARTRPLLRFRCTMALAAFASLITCAPAAGQGDEFAANARLIGAIRSEDAAGVERALRDGASVDAHNRLGESALLAAIKKNRADIARTLLAAGANVNDAAVNGVTPLMAAAYGGDTALTRDLLAKGANPGAVDRVGKNAITYAAGEGHTEI